MANYVTPLLKIFHWFPTPLRVKIKVLAVAAMALQQWGSAHLSGFISNLSLPVS